MSREDFKNINLNNLISDINKEWDSEKDLKINKDTKNHTLSLAHKGKTLSEEHKQKIKLASIGKKHIYLRKHTEEEKLHKSKISKGRIVSLETRKKLSEINIGKKKSEETKQKISLSKIGTKISQENIEKLRLSHLGKPRSEETKKKISDALKGRIDTEETKQKRLITRIKNGNTVKLFINGKSYNSLKEISNIFKIPYGTIKDRYKKGYRNKDLINSIK